jgi:outer membrane receptor for ferrienterochelin and colicins
MRTLIFLLIFSVCLPVLAQVPDTTIEDEHETEEIIVTSTRTSGRIEDAPTRVEVLGEDEISEKQTMVPSNVSMLLSETPGILAQQTSSVTGSMSFKLQGLDGKYTQILKDGFPMFSGLVSGLSVLQIPPLDLKQVEIIKGPSSSLYGGDAVAGIVNLISKTPEEGFTFDALLNANSNRGYDVNAFITGRHGKLGYSLLATRQYQRAKDADGDGFADIPQIEGLMINPKLFIYFNKSTTLWLSFFASRQKREGGYLWGSFEFTPYTEQLTGNLVYSQAAFSKKFEDGDILNIKNSVMYFRRLDELPPLFPDFSGRQWNSFSEISFAMPGKKISNVFGINLNTEDFKAHNLYDLEWLKKSYRYITLGFFIQSEIKAAKKFTIQSGLRIDYNDEKKSFLVPRIAGIYKFTKHFDFRLGGGLGYKLPAFFSDESELVSYNEILPLNAGLKAERSYGINADLNYEKTFGNWSVNLNQAYYFTQVREPLVLVPSGSMYEYVNADGHINTQGLETNLRVRYGDVKLFAGYTFIDADKKFGGARETVFLIPKHRIISNLVYERHGWGRAALEAYWTGKQYLSDGTLGKDYWLLGFFAEKTFGHFSFFLNFENFTNVKQSNFGPVVLPPTYDPVFQDVYAPLEGFQVNGGIKIRVM